MKKILLVGKSGSGKTTLTQALQGLDLRYRKTQAVSYVGCFVDTPGEYLENRRYYSALIASSTQCDVVALVQDGTALNSVFPPKFASMFTKNVIGIVSKVDHEGCDRVRAEKFLHWAGVKEVVCTSSVDNIGLTDLENYLIIDR